VSETCESPYKNQRAEKEQSITGEKVQQKLKRNMLGRASSQVCHIWMRPSVSLCFQNACNGRTSSGNLVPAPVAVSGASVSQWLPHRN